MSKDIDLLMQSLEKIDLDIRELRDDIHRLREEVKDLHAFKWKVYGMAAVISFCLGLLTTFIGGK